MSLKKETDKAVSEETVSYTYTVPVRFETAGRPYSFGTEDPGIRRGMYVVVETQQGTELGICEGDSLEIRKYGLRMPTRPVLRVATEHDRHQYEANKAENDRAFDICSREIRELGLQMNLLSAQYTLDRAKILFIYLSEQRVDFRELLKRLGARLHCRIELRQIGERDKAKMVGGIGMCGMECCCRRFKSRFDVISINMAKTQLLALNIDKLSGMCGKLLCCLSYENDDYKEMTAGLPKMGSQVEYEGNIYRITNMNVMSNEAKLENRENAVFITLDDLRTKAIPRKGVVMPKKKDDDGRPVRKSVVHASSAARPESRRTAERKPTAPKTEVRTFGRRKDEAKEHHRIQHEENRSRVHRQQPRSGSENRTAETRNITVRTFSRKKKENEESR